MFLFFISCVFKSFLCGFTRTDGNSLLKRPVPFFFFRLSTIEELLRPSLDFRHWLLLSVWPTRIESTWFMYFYPKLVLYTHTFPCRIDRSNAECPYAKFVCKFFYLLDILHRRIIKLLPRRTFISYRLKPSMNVNDWKKKKMYTLIISALYSRTRV